ncbi:MAG: sensor histidine kinase [Tenericutes bacterium]|nr:sensor histidine kinase [Mycoplasmatota bacterium]
MFDPVIFRLFISQAFLCFLFISITPIKTPKKRNTIIIVIGAFIITSINALIITQFGLLDFYARYYVLTLILPYIVLIWNFAIHKGPKLLFGILTCEVFGNVAIVNGLLASYLLYGYDNPLVDGLVRMATFLMLMPLFLMVVKPKFIEIAETLDKGWWILCSVLVASYILTYYVGFVPESLLAQPENFKHAYLSILLSGLIYLVIFNFFLVTQAKFNTERDKQLLSTQVNSIANQSEMITSAQEKIKIIRHDVRHQLRIIEEHINEGNLSEANKFLNLCRDELANSTTKVYCENIAINATLSYYFDLAERNKIRVKSKVEIPKLININNAELAVAYANSLENAVNACIKEPDEKKRFISLSSRYIKNQIIIDMSNACSTKIKFNKKGIPYTNERGHGIGIMSILAFSKKYDSIIKFSQDMDVFHFKLLINL